jgi:SRSO17 transposase
VFRTKPQIALEQVEHALSNGVRVFAWTFDELYGRDGGFLNGLERLEQMFVGEVPKDFRGWLKEPPVIQNARKRPGKSPRARRRSTPYVPGYCPARKVQNLLRHSLVFRKQRWQRYCIKDTDKGPCVWEVKWAPIWRKDENDLPSRRHCLIVARNVRTGEVKYFLSNRCPGDTHPQTKKRITLRGLLRVAFGRWSIESCFREGKEELGMDHYEVRGWGCVHRHFYVTQLSHLFCARVREEFDKTSDRPDRLSIEQVRSAMNVWLDSADLPSTARQQRYQAELDRQQYYQHRNRQARESHNKTRKQRLLKIGIDPDKIKSCIPPENNST